MKNIFIISMIAVPCFLSADQANQNAPQEKRGAPDLQVNIQHGGHRSQEFQIENTGTADDRRILNQVTELLKKRSNSNLQIHIEDGIVTMSGVVKNSEDILDIQNEILNIQGVKGVNNKLFTEKKYR